MEIFYRIFSYLSMLAERHKIQNPQKMKVSFEVLWCALDSFQHVGLARQEVIQGFLQQVCVGVAREKIDHDKG